MREVVKRYKFPVRKLVSPGDPMRTKFCDTVPCT